MRIGLISDTHGKLRAEALKALDGVDLIVHAGDIGRLDIITELEAIAPVRAVHGNTDDLDIRARHGDTEEITVDNTSIVVVHGHLLNSTGAESLRAAYPNADVVVYGHTHKPLLDASAKPLVINPGAAGPARFHLKPSVAILDVPALTVHFIEL